jgi:hypothetical protein
MSPHRHRRFAALSGMYLSLQYLPLSNAVVLKFVCSKSYGLLRPIFLRETLSSKEILAGRGHLMNEIASIGIYANSKQSLWGYFDCQTSGSSQWPAEESIGGRYIGENNNLYDNVKSPFPLLMMLYSYDFVGQLWWAPSEQLVPACQAACFPVCPFAPRHVLPRNWESSTCTSCPVVLRFAKCIGFHIRCPTPIASFSDGVFSTSCSCPDS